MTLLVIQISEAEKKNILLAVMLDSTLYWLSVNNDPFAFGGCPKQDSKIIKQCLGGLNTNHKHNQTSKIVCC